MSYSSEALKLKVNVCSGYNFVLVHPDDRLLLGMLWVGLLFVNTALSFGLQSAPKVFTVLADAAG